MADYELLGYGLGRECGHSSGFGGHDFGHRGLGEGFGGGIGQGGGIGHGRVFYNTESVTTETTVTNNITMIKNYYRDPTEDIPGRGPDNGDNYEPCYPGAEMPDMTRVEITMMEDINRGMEEALMMEDITRRMGVEKGALPETLTINCDMSSSSWHF